MRNDETGDSYSRRSTDSEQISELYLLKAEVDLVQKELGKYLKRVEDCERHFSTLSEQLSRAKGVFYGVALILSGIGYLISDRLKELFIK